MKFELSLFLGVLDAQAWTKNTVCVCLSVAFFLGTRELAWTGVIVETHDMLCRHMWSKS
jgi:hypothetical protein